MYERMLQNAADPEELLRIVLIYLTDLEFDPDKHKAGFPWSDEEVDAALTQVCHLLSYLRDPDGYAVRRQDFDFVDSVLAAIQDVLL